MPIQTRPEENRDLIQLVDSAVLRMLRNGLSSRRIRPCPRHPLALDPDRRLRFAAAVAAASESHGIPASLLLAIAFREGSYRHRSLGKRGELSSFQIAPSTAVWVARKEPRCDIKTIEGSAHCAAFFLNYYENVCGSLEKSFVRYVTGKSCNYNTPKVRWIIKDRFGIAAELGDF